MKKLFTLVALLACFIGAKAEWVTDKEIKFSDYTGFPHYVMGYVPEFIDGVMTDFGANFKYIENKDGVLMDGDKEYQLADGETVVSYVKTQTGVEYAKIQLPSPGWHQYFAITGVPTQLDGSYRVTAMVRASEACNVSAQFRWSWSEDPINGSASIGTDWAEVEWNFSNVGGTACDFIVQPGGITATIEWQWIKVEHNEKPQAPKEWIELLDNSKTPSAQYINKTHDDFVRIQDLTGDDAFNANYELVKSAKYDEAEGAYIVHTLAAPKEEFADLNDANSYAWANQFFIVSPEKINTGDKIKVSFDYKAKEAANTNTQAHGLPTDYHHWQCVGDVAFTTEWQSLTKEVTVDAAWAGTNGMYSVAFNLNPDNQNENEFYFKNLSICRLKLEEGYFIAGQNKAAGIEYDCAAAIAFTEGEGDDEGLLVATVGEKGAYVNEVMISTVKGDDESFKSHTLKPEYNPTNDPEDFINYSAVSLAKIPLPSAGIWKVRLDTEYGAMTFEMLEGEAPREPLDIKPNPTEIIINATERDWKPAKTGDGVEPNTPQDGEEGIGTGQPWDNQFFLKADRALETGEEVVIEFDYMATAAAKTTTQCQNGNFGYIWWNALGDVNFTTEWQHFTKTYTVPADCKNELQVFAFNLSEIKAANEYHIKNIVWKTADNLETLIDMNTDNGKNFFVKTNSGGVEPNGIKTVNTTSVRTNAMYNLAGQRVSKDFKGIAIKNGQKFIVK